MTNLYAVVENDEVRDRKACIALNQRVEGANRELAQWLIDHPRYPATIVSEWLGCGVTRIKELRRWAQEGFGLTPAEKRLQRNDRRRAGDEPLKSQDNSSDGDEEDNDDPEMEVASPEEIKSNILDTIERQKAVALSYKKVLGVSSLDQASKDEISAAIGTLVSRWQSLQKALGPRRT